MEPFAARLDHLMAQRSMSQSELARRSGLTQSAISLYLDDKRQPGAPSIEKMATALGVDPAWEFIEYRRWKLHQALDQWIDQDEDTVEFLLARLRPGQGRPE